VERIVIDAALAARLRQLSGPAELVDPAGALVTVVPSHAAVEGEDLTAEEIERRFREDARVPATDVLRRLRELA